MLVVQGWKEYIKGEWKIKIADLSPGQGYCMICDEGERPTASMPNSTDPEYSVRKETVLNQNAAFVEICYVSRDNGGEVFSSMGIAMTNCYNNIVKKHPAWKGSSFKEDDWLLREESGKFIFYRKELTDLFGRDSVLIRIKPGTAFCLCFSAASGKIQSYSYFPL